MSSSDTPTWTIETSHSIMEMVRVKDEATYQHCIRVSRNARLLAEAAGLNESEQKIVEFAGLFHDIGKIGVPDDILNKPAQLTDAEYAVMKSHPMLSVQILKPLTTVEFFQKIIPGVRHHHERFDGRGYPNGVSGELIPLASRLILVVDTFDAMTADRAYRKGLPWEVAYQELKDFAGKQFDPRLVEIFLKAHPRWQVQGNKIFEEMTQTVLKAA